MIDTNKGIIDFRWQGESDGGYSKLSIQLKSRGK